MPEPSRTSASTTRQILANRGFVACVLLLLTFTITFEVLAKIKHIQFRKLPVPLRKPLNLLDQSALRQLLFTLPSDLRGHLYEGQPSQVVVSAFDQQGYKLGPNTRVEVSVPRSRWKISTQDLQTQLDLTLTIEHDPASQRLNVYAPYLLINATEIKPEILDGLGTDQYIQWVLLDLSHARAPQPEDFIQLFVTYYTGAPDQVPHVPEECYTGGGFDRTGDSLLEVPVPALGPNATVSFRVLEFDSPQFGGQGTKLVMYVFHTNGRFCADRNCGRSTVADPFVRHAYFSKLEVSFGTSDALPSKEKAIEAGKRFLAVVVPVLLKDHWPDWDQVLRSEKESRTAETTTAN
jgi:hypothetical protein